MRRCDFVLFSFSFHSHRSIVRILKEMRALGQFVAFNIYCCLVVISSKLLEISFFTHVERCCCEIPSNDNVNDCVIFRASNHHQRSQAHRSARISFVLFWSNACFPFRSGDDREEKKKKKKSTFANYNNVSDEANHMKRARLRPNAI